MTTIERMHTEARKQAEYANEMLERALTEQFGKNHSEYRYSLALREEWNSHVWAAYTWKVKCDAAMWETTKAIDPEGGSCDRCGRYTTYTEAGIGYRHASCY